MKRKRKIILLFAISLSVFFVRGNVTNTIDSLKSLLIKSNHDTLRCRLLNEIITEEYDEKIWPKYNQQLLEISQKNLKKANNKERGFYLSYYALALNNFGYLYEMQGEISKAFEYFNESLSIQKENNDKLGMSGSLLNLGKLFRQQGNIVKALEYYQQALKLQIEINDKIGMATSYNNIGYVYDSQGEYLKAFEYYNKALKINEEINDLGSIANCYSNLAFLYNTQSELFFSGSKEDCAKKGHAKAIDLLNKSIKLQEQIKDNEGLASSYNSLGNLYENFGDPFVNYQKQTVVN